MNPNDPQDQKTQPQGHQPLYAYPPQYPDDEIDLLELWNAIWQGKWSVIGITFVFAVISGTITLLMPNIYKSEALLAPVSDEQQGMLSNVAGQLGGLAGLAGIDVGRVGGVDKTTLALEVVQSRAFITEFIRKHELEVPLLAVDGWDSVADEWIIDPDKYDLNQQKWVRKVRPPKTVEPSNEELLEEFRQQLVVNQDKRTNLVYLSIKSISPIAAKTWVELLVSDLNSYMREEDIKDAKQSIRYLQDQLNKTSVSEMQNIFYELIEQQTKKMMLAEVREEYAFKIIDPPVHPEKKYSPKRGKIITVSTIVGLFFSIIVLFVREAYQKKLQYFSKKNNAGF